MKFKSLILAAATVVLALAACKEKEVVPTGISVDKTVLDDVPIAGGSYTVKVTSSEDWTAKPAKSWISVSPASGKTGTTEVIVTVAANESKSRSSRVTFSAGLMYNAVIQINQLSAVPEGDGSKERPFSASEAHEWGIKNITEDKTASEQKYYIKGKISKIASAKQKDKDGNETSVEQYFSANEYGNASFYITDDGEKAEDGKDFEAFQVNYLGNRAFNKETDTDIKIGDEVIIYGTIYKYGTTIETEGKGAACIYSLNGKAVEIIESIPSGEGTKESPYNVAKALQECKKLKYTNTSTYETKNAYVEGVIYSITSIELEEYGNAEYSIVDEGFTTSLGVYRGFYLAAAKFTSADQIKVGDKVIIKGDLCNMFGNKPQFAQGNNIVCLNGEWEREAQTVTGTVTQALAALDNDNVVINDAIVALLGDKGFVVTDGTSNVYVYADALLTEVAKDLKVGDKVKVEAKKTTFNGVPELVNVDKENKIKITILNSGNDVPRTEKKDITATLDAYNSAVTEYVEVKGLVSKDDKGYYNLTVAGATRQASLYAVPASFDVAKFEGKAVSLVGYYVGINTKKIVCVIPETLTESDDIKYCTIDVKTKTVKADVTSFKFNVSANAAWTFSYAGETPNPNVTITPSEGTADAEVTVTFPANTSEEAEVVYPFTLACEAAGVAENIVITQRKAASAAGYTRVASIDELSVGDEIVIVAIKGTDCFVNGTIGTTTKDGKTTDNTWLDSVAATDADGVIAEMPDDAALITLGGEKDKWTLSIDGKKIGATAAKKLAFDKGTTTWKIEFDANTGTATINSTNSACGRFLYNVNSPRFCNYTSNTSSIMLLPYIYKK